LQPIRKPLFFSFDALFIIAVQGSKNKWENEKRLGKRQENWSKNNPILIIVVSKPAKNFERAIGFPDT
jgi:hypothetical protein